MQTGLKIVWLLCKGSIKAYISSPLGVILFSTGKVLRFLLLFLFIIFIANSTKTLKGYTPNQAIIFYLSYNIIDTLSQFLFREVYRFRPLIVSGEFDFVLLKPFNPFLRILVGGVDILDLVMLFFYLPLTFIVIVNSGYQQIVPFVFYIIMLINALLIATAFHILVLAMGILTTEVDHTVMILRDISAVGRFPLDIYHQNIRMLLTFVIPVAIMVYFPAKALFGLVNPLTILALIFFSLFILWLSLKIWTKAIRYYQSWGG